MMAYLGKSFAGAKNKKGFTLIELVVVIAIMAILAAVMVPNLTSYINKADDAVVKANIKTVHTAASIVHQTEGGLPNKAKVANFANIAEGDILDVAPTATGQYQITVADGVITVISHNGVAPVSFDGKAFN